MTAATEPALELDDIQAGALYERPSPYVGTYLLLRIDDRADGRELVRRLHRLVDSGRPSADPRDDTSITVAFTYHGLEALGVPQASLDSFAPGVPGRDGGARRRCWATSARAVPTTGSSRSARADVHVAIAVALPGRRAARGCRREGPARPRRAARASS